MQTMRRLFLLGYYLYGADYRHARVLLCLLHLCDKLLHSTIYH